MTIFSALALGLVLSQPVSNGNNNAVPSQPSDNAAVKTQLLTIDASDKTNFVFFDLVDGTLTPSTESDSWIFGVRRYIFKTYTGPNGTSIGGAYFGAGADFDSFQTCSNVVFEQDQTVSMLGYTIDANALMTSEWFDYNEEGSVVPMDKFFAVARDTDCLKLKIHTYATGVYEIEYQAVPFVLAE